MNETTWIDATDWVRLLNVAGAANHPQGSRPRKLRLWTVACCRRVLAAQRLDPEFLQYVPLRDILNDAWDSPWKTVAPLDDWERHLESAEAYADGRLSRKRLQKDRHVLGGPWSLFHLPISHSRMTVAEVVRTLDGFMRMHPAPSAAELVGFTRDIYGNPFRPVVFDPSWRREHTIGIASKMYDERDFAAMPILADALEEAGCENADILTHCREPGVHVRGCWVVDLVLGKG